VGRQVEEMRRLAREWREGNQEAFQTLNTNVANYSAEELGHVRLNLNSPPPHVGVYHV
jgi:hypothetical protein